MFLLLINSFFFLWWVEWCLIGEDHAFKGGTAHTAHLSTPTSINRFPPNRAWIVFICWSILWKPLQILEVHFPKSDSHFYFQQVCFTRSFHVPKRPEMKPPFAICTNKQWNSVKVACDCFMTLFPLKTLKTLSHLDLNLILVGLCTVQIPQDLAQEWECSHLPPPCHDNHSWPVRKWNSATALILLKIPLVVPIPIKTRGRQNTILPLPLIRRPVHFLPKRQEAGAQGKIQLSFSIDLLQKKNEKKWHNKTGQRNQIRGKLKAFPRKSIKIDGAGPLLGFREYYHGYAIPNME